MNDTLELKPLAISCTDTDCENDLHCFLQKKERGAPMRHGGPCRDCSADLVKWDRVATCDIQDVQYTFDALQKELIRHEFWHRTIDQRALNYARRKGRRQLREAVRHRLETAIGGINNPREGRQTPFAGNIIYYAQHSVAACCRKCVEYWHGIESNRPLREAEVDYMTELIMLYVAQRMPDLEEEPVKVPPIRSVTSARKHEDV